MEKQISLTETEIYGIIQTISAEWNSRDFTALAHWIATNPLEENEIKEKIDAIMAAQSNKIMEKLNKYRKIEVENDFDNLIIK